MEIKVSTLKKIGIASLLFVVAIIGIFSLNQSEEGNKSDTNSEVLDAQVESRLFEYSETTLAKIAEDYDKTILFVGAEWCAGCVVLEEDLRAKTSDIPENVAIVLADYDTDLDIIEKYDVKTQHTLVEVDKDLNKVKDYVGGYTLDEVLKKFEVI